jgi:hypothetical protein
LVINTKFSIVSTLIKKMIDGFNEPKFSIVSTLNKQMLDGFHLLVEEST